MNLMWVSRCTNNNNPPLDLRISTSSGQRISRNVVDTDNEDPDVLFGDSKEGANDDSNLILISAKQFADMTRKSLQAEDQDESRDMKNDVNMPNWPPRFALFIRMKLLSWSTSSWGRSSFSKKEYMNIVILTVINIVCASRPPP